MTYISMVYAGMMRYWILISLLFFTVASAEIYRSVDEDGNVIFSDEPGPDSEKIELPEVQTITLPPVQKTKPKPAATMSVEGYSSLAILSPENDASIRENTGNINVRVGLQPGLLQGDMLYIYLDGEEVAAGKQTSISLENVDRGSHQLRAAIKGADGKIRKSSESVTFHLLRYSASQRKPAGGN